MKFQNSLQAYESFEMKWIIIHVQHLSYYVGLLFDEFTFSVKFCDTCPMNSALHHWIIINFCKNWNKTTIVKINVNDYRCKTWPIILYFFLVLFIVQTTNWVGKISVDNLAINYNSWICCMFLNWVGSELYSTVIFWLIRNLPVLIRKAYWKMWPELRE